MIVRGVQGQNLCQRQVRLNLLLVTLVLLRPRRQPARDTAGGQPPAKAFAQRGAAPGALAAPRCQPHAGSDSQQAGHKRHPQPAQQSGEGGGRASTGRAWERWG